MDEIELANDYINSIEQSGEIFKDGVTNICTNIDDMMARLDEFESLLYTIKSNSNKFIKNTVPQIIAFKPELDKLTHRIDNMEKIFNLIDNNLTNLEEVVETAQTDLNIKEFSIKKFFKPFFRKSTTDFLKRNVDENGDFVRPKIFKTSDYFPAEQIHRNI